MQQSHPQKPQGSFALSRGCIFCHSLGVWWKPCVCLSVHLSTPLLPPLGLSRWEQRARSSTMPVHKKLKVPFRLAKNAVVSIVICRQPSAAFSPSTITPVASPSHRSCTRVKSSHLSALPSAFVSVCPARWSSSSLKQGMLHL